MMAIFIRHYNISTNIFSTNIFRINYMGILGILVAMIAGFVMPKNLISIDSLAYAGLYLCGFLFVCSLSTLFVYWRNKRL
ncbi:putative membrane protein [Francisella tularensis]|nr:putative membrane protein [Francisella tularensis]